MRIAIVSAILFLSGCSALLFQTLWLRLSGLAFGNSVWSAALILSSFMAGLALGSAFAASTTLSRLRPLAVYAGLVRRFDSFELHGRSRPWKRICRLDHAFAASTACCLCRFGNDRGDFRVQRRVRASAARGMRS